MPDFGRCAARPIRATSAIDIRDNKFTEDGNAIVAGNIPVLVERNDFINAHEAAIHVVGAGAVIARQPHQWRRIDGHRRRECSRRGHRGQRAGGVDGVRHHAAGIVQHLGAGQPTAQLRLRARLRSRRPEEREPRGRQHHHRAQVQRHRRDRRLAQAAAATRCCAPTRTRCTSRTSSRRAEKR